VKESCKEAVATAAEVDISVVECTVTIGSDSRRLQVDLAEELLTYEVSFVIATPPEEGESLRELISSMSVSNETTFSTQLEEAILVLVANTTLTSNTYVFGRLLPVPTDNAVSAFMFEVARQEAQALDSLLAGNETRVTLSVGGITIVAAKLSRADLEEAGGAALEAGGQASAFVPLSIFDEMEADPLIMVLTDLGTSLAPLTPTEDADEVMVEGTLGMNLYDDQGAALRVSNLSSHIQLAFAVGDAPQVSCAYWDEEAAEWTSDGVFQDGFFNGTLACSTDHLSFFGAIARGFLNTLKCSQAGLFTASGFDQLRDGQWMYTGATVFMFWVLMVGLIAIFGTACYLDHKRWSEDPWNDEHFLSYRHQDMLLRTESSQTQKDTGRCWLVASMIGAWAFFLTYGQVIWDVFKDIFYSLVLDHLDLVRDSCEGVVGFFWDAWSEAGYGGRGFTYVFFLGMSRHVTGQIAHYTACAKNGTHFDDADRVLKHHEAAKAEKEVHLSEGSDQPLETQDGAETTELGGKSTHTLNKSHKSVGSLNNSGGKRGKSQSFNPLSESSSTGVAKLAVGALKFQELHQAHTGRLQEEAGRALHFLQIPRNIFIQFVVNGPVGAVFTKSIHTPCKVRAMVLICSIVGTVAVSTFFMSLTGRSHSNRNPPECAAAQDEGEYIGSMIANGLIAALCADVPTVLLLNLHNREFVELDYPGSKAARKQLRHWRNMDAVLWGVSIPYAGFCVLFMMLFMANVDQSDHESWRGMVVVGMLGDLVIIPLALVLMPIVLLLISVVVLSIVTMKCPTDVMALIHGEVLKQHQLADVAKDSPGPDTAEDSSASLDGKPMDGCSVDERSNASPGGCKHVVLTLEDVTPKPGGGESTPSAMLGAVLIDIDNPNETPKATDDTAVPVEVMKEELEEWQRRSDWQLVMRKGDYDKSPGSGVIKRSVV